MIAQVICKDCHNETSLRGFVTRDDLIGTKYEKVKDFITDDELHALEEAGEIQDEFDRWDDICPVCGSKNVIWF